MRQPKSIYYRVGKIKKLVMKKKNQKLLLSKETISNVSQASIRGGAKNNQKSKLISVCGTCDRICEVDWTSLDTR